MKKIFVPIILLMSMFLVAGCGKEEKVEKPVEEETITMIKDQQIGSLNIKSFNINFDKDDNLSYVYFEVENTSTEAANVSKITYSLYKDGVLVISIPGNLDGPIEPGGIRIITSSLDLNLADVDKVEYSVK